MTPPRTLTLLALAAVLAGGCDAFGPTTRVALNERIFELPSRSSGGKACTRFELKKGKTHHEGEPPGPIGGSAPPGLVVGQRSDGEAVLIEVTEGKLVVAQRRYDESFFRAGKLDEFTAQGSSGQQRMLRYWGAVATDDGPAPCAPFEDDGDALK